MSTPYFQKYDINTANRSEDVIRIKNQVNEVDFETDIRVSLPSCIIMYSGEVHIRKCNFDEWKNKTSKCMTCLKIHTCRKRASVVLVHR
jgi:hypothetical protein